MKAFARRAPEVKARSLYQWLDEHRDALALPRRSGGANACVYDPCNSRADPAARAGVRSLASACGFSLEEIAFSGERAACCGFGGHIYPANPKLVEEIIQIRTEASAAEYIAYCANCRDYFRSSGKESRHILEILFGEEADESGGRRGSGPAGQPEGSPGPESRDFEPPGPGSRDFEPPDPGSSSPESRDPGSPGADKTSLSGLSEQRENRRTLKEKFLGKSASPDKPSPGAAVTVDIPRALREKMNRLLLLDEDVADAIAFCETQDRKIFNKGSGSYIGYHRRRTLTIWVEYEMTDEANAALHNVYTHRMEIRDREQTG
jgi:hypothetical protein